MIDAQGYEAVEARVIGSWEKWLSEGRFLFRPKAVAQHHDVVKFDWTMTKFPGGEVEASGVSFLILNPAGRIAYDYQFNPTANDAEDLVERYVALWNEADSGTRLRRIGALFAPDGAYLSRSSTAKGHAGIEAAAATAREACGAGSLRYVSAGFSQAHHRVAQFQWRMRPAEGGADVAAGSDLVILDEEGRIRFDYQFEEAAQIAEDEAGIAVFRRSA